jgi:circadian clock protein KaiC
MFTALTLNTATPQSDEGVSSLVDAWLSLRDIELNGERNRALYIMKSRGMYHSNQVREFIITDNGLKLVNVYLGPEGVLTGSAREAQELQEESSNATRKTELLRKDKSIERKKMLLEAKIAALNSEFETEKEELDNNYLQQELKTKIVENNRRRLSVKRTGALNSGTEKRKKS